MTKRYSSKPVFKMGLESKVAFLMSFMDAPAKNDTGKVILVIIDYGCISFILVISLSTNSKERKTT